MERVRSIVALARRRLLLAAWVASAWHAASLAMLALALASAAFRLAGRPWTAAGWSVAGLASLALVAAWSWSRALRAGRDPIAVSMLADERLGSGERLTTALALSASPGAADDPFAAAAIADAERFASDRALPAALRSGLPIRLPARWWWLPASAALLAVACLAVPVPGPAGVPEARAAAGERGTTDEERRLAAAVAAVESNPDLAEQLEAELRAARNALEGGDGAAPRAPDEASREALRRAAELQARLAEVMDAPEQQASRDLRDALAGLDLPPEEGAARDLAEALKQGDFEAAQAALERLQQEIGAQDALSPEDRAKLAAQLGDLAQQLGDMSKDPSRLSESLQAAGMDPSLAGSPEALEGALDRASQLNESQKAAIRSAAKASKASREKLAKMGDKVSKMCKACKNPGKGQPKEDAAGAASEMGEMLSEAEADEQLSMAAESASQAAQSGGSRAGSSGGGQGAGGGIGSEGTVERGEARDAALGKDRFGTKARAETGSGREGNVIAQQLVAGDAPVGESRVALEKVASQIAPGYERGTEDDPVPAHLKEVHKEYFGDLRKRLERKGVRVPAAEPAPAAAPATGAPAPAAAPATGASAPAAAPPRTGGGNGR